MATFFPTYDSEKNLIGYQAKVRLKGQPHINKTFRTKREAKEWATHVESQLLARRDALEVAQTVGKRPVVGYLDDLDFDAIMSTVALLDDGKRKADKDGYVYIALSPALGWRQVKIGRTINLDQRMRDLSRDTGVPESFNAVYYKRFTDASLAEAVMHAVFDEQRMNDKREFFAVPVQHVIEVLDMLADVMHGGRTH